VAEERRRLSSPWGGVDATRFRLVLEHTLNLHTGKREQTGNARRHSQFGHSLSRECRKLSDYVFGQNMTEYNPAPSPSGHPLLSGPPT
jgi:hypothetical protein